ncbi:MAG TPA: M13 family metallopeptidase [Bradyrhizobium sp.]|uniref:M13 family metallopeptidase n=1 Tax=Bradyrhizobium sp. TaxID=376 RepID=UPI002D0AAC9E|nr:M13 family metallopeptidase [Bradyrhizobium sp.]HTB04407.1 M13 family metallopeptidase [Bradyrhizobium sp.]
MEIEGRLVYCAAMLRKFILALAIGVAFPGMPMAEPRSGIDVSAIDPAVRPQDDFWQFANGKWLAATTIPPDRPAWNTFLQVYETTQKQLREAIEGIDPLSPEGSEPRKLADLYGSFMDEAGVEAAGLSGLRDELSRIHGIGDKAALPATFARLSRLWVRIPWDLDIGPDEHDATRYVAHLEQSQLGLPDRDYYLKDDAHFGAIRAAYRQHIVKLLALAGEPATAEIADGIIALEIEIARLQWTRVENRDPLKTYNKREISALPALVTTDDWPAYLAAAGVGADVSTLIVAQPSYFDQIGAILREVPLATWQAYLAYNLLSAYAPYLSQPFVDEDFAFEQHRLRGVPENLPRWKRGVATVDRLIGFALGRLYVARYFPPANKARAEAMVANLLAAYRESIAALDWMGPETRRQALDKLSKIRPMIGYPDKWRDYSKLEIRRDDLTGNVMRARAFGTDFWMAKLGHEVDRDEWRTSPQTINAYYDPNRNQITFPAGILQPPFFDASADDAANYGGIGTVIGHEISHAFDDQGSRFDGEGNLRNWWSDEDRARFDAKTKSLVAQYDAFSPLPGYHVNGALTLGENVADNAGLAIAERAWRLSLGGCPAPKIDGYSGEQRLFISFAQIWHDKMRDAARIERLKVDPHSPGQFRANGSLRNQGAFDLAFDVKPGDAMYLAPDQRISLWQVDRDIECKEKNR